MTFRIAIWDIRPSGHKIKVYDAEFGCKNAGNHKKDILHFLEQLETVCPEHMDPVQIHLGR
jgi:hypothetical protein